MEKKLRDIHFSFYKDSNFLRFRQFFLERDILRIACSLFEAEKRIKKLEDFDELTIPLSEKTFDRIDKEKLKEVLEKLIRLIFVEEIDIKFEKIDDEKRRVKKDVVFKKKDVICLFSGGLDSYSGITLAEKEYKDILGVFVAHNDQSRIIKIVNEFKNKIKSPIKTIYAPSMGSEGYSQFRGFLYTLSGGIFLKLCNTRKLLITECGPTMYQPMFSIYDSITYTTHPYVLSAAKEILTIMLGFEPEIILPFEDLTKSEVVSNSGILDFSDTHSCISQRFGDHDGTCFGCVIKRLSCLTSGVRDVKYKKDIFEEETNQDNLFNVLEFSRKIIKKYVELPNFQKDKIEEFGKQNLFERFALDNLSGLMVGTKTENFLHSRYIKKNLIPILKRRINEVRANIKKPNFNKKV